MRRRAVTNVELAAWRALYLEGTSLRGIAAEYDREHKTVLYALRRAGVPLRPRNQYKPPSRFTWDLDYCIQCGKEKRINPRTGWCHGCSLPRPGSTPTSARRMGQYEA